MLSHIDEVSAKNVVIENLIRNSLNLWLVVVDEFVFANIVKLDSDKFLITARGMDQPIPTHSIDESIDILIKPFTEWYNGTVDRLNDSSRVVFQNDKFLAMKKDNSVIVIKSFIESTFSVYNIDDNAFEVLKKHYVDSDVINKNMLDNIKMKCVS